MSDLTIHCAACHSFVAPVVPDSLVVGGGRTGIDAAVLPDTDECFSCHVMRTLVAMPDPDPHRGSCAACHNPHEQAEPADAVESCTAAGCHTEADQVTPFHRGMQPGILEDCTYCHQAHDFSVDGSACLDCHEGIDRDSLTISLPPRDVRSPQPDTSTAPPDTSTTAEISGGLVLSPVADPLLGVGLGWWAHPPGIQQVEQGPQFSHSRHREVECGNCHSSADEHGGLTVRTLSDCRSCHHTEPVARNCARCHDAQDAPDRTFRVTQSVTFSVGSSDPSRVMSFPHGTHAQLDCATCHTEGLRLVSAGVDCASCHEDHHVPENDCASCHRAAPVSVHPPSEAHVTCSGAGCHQAVPFDSVPRTRTVCLGCHQTMRDHRPGQTCAECHTLPRPRGNQ
jgi:hypothetical protein